MKKVISLCLTVALAVSVFAGCSCGRDDEIDKEAGYKVDKYITLGKYKGFDYNIDQKKFDEELAFNTYDAQGVKRAAKKGDEIEFSTVGYIAGKKVDDLSRKNVEEEMEKEKKLNRKFRLRHIPFDDTIKVTKKAIQPLLKRQEKTQVIYLRKRRNILKMLYLK